MFNVCVVYRQRPCDKLITRSVLDLVTEVKRKVSWRRPRPELGCRAKKGRVCMLHGCSVERKHLPSHARGTYLTHSDSPAFRVAHHCTLHFEGWYLPCFRPISIWINFGINYNSFDILISVAPVTNNRHVETCPDFFFIFSLQEHTQQNPLSNF
jgi:hypothetical protein